MKRYFRWFAVSAGILAIGFNVFKFLTCSRVGNPGTLADDCFGRLLQRQEYFILLFPLNFTPPFIFLLLFMLLNIFSSSLVSFKFLKRS